MEESGYMDPMSWLTSLIIAILSHCSKFLQFHWNILYYGVYSIEKYLLIMYFLSKNIISSCVSEQYEREEQFITSFRPWTNRESHMVGHYIPDIILYIIVAIVYCSILNNMLYWNKGCCFLTLESNSIITNGCPDAHPCSTIYC
jgi:hypothetical protein